MKLLNWIGRAGKTLYTFVGCMVVGSVTMVIAACYGLFVTPIVKAN
jgi:hypothetical protein